MTRRILSDEQERLLVEEYEGSDDWTINELSVMFKVSHRTVYRVLSKHKAKRDKYDRVEMRGGRNALGQFTLKRKNKKEKPPRQLMPCGTNAAYARHKHKGEYPCTPCLEAHAEDVRNFKEKKRA